MGKTEVHRFLNPFEIATLSFLGMFGFEGAQRRVIRDALEQHAHQVGEWAYDVFPPFFKDGNPGRAFDSLNLGDSESVTVQIRPQHLLYFARASGDWGAPHFDREYAETTRFKKPIAHGLLVGSLISPVLAHKLPGMGTIYEAQDFRFKAPVFIDDTVTATVTVTKLEPESRRVTLTTQIVNQDNQVVIDGQAIVRARKN